jgi:hypothetical protein
MSLVVWLASALPGDPAETAMRDSHPDEGRDYGHRRGDPFHGEAIARRDPLIYPRSLSLAVSDLVASLGASDGFGHRGPDGRMLSARIE